MSRLAQLAARSRANGSGPSVESEPTQFRVVRWFDSVREDRKKYIKPAVEYYLSAVEDGRKYVTAMGNVEYLLAETPGLEHYYKGILVDCQQVRRWMEAVEESMTARKYKHFMFDPEVRRKYGDLKTTEISKLVQAEDDIIEVKFQIRNIANAENHLLSLIEGFTTRNMNLTTIVKIRQANLQDVWIDPTKGTSNV